MQWETVIGLEVHTQLSTLSKIFSGSSIAYGAAPNTQASAVDIALPGVLPVLNRGAVERAIQFGLAIGANINRHNVFDRKNYFYPDLPKGYQISQLAIPIIEGGDLTIQVGPSTSSGQAYDKTVRLTRAHLEEDAGKSLHENFEGMTGIDLNRAGTPLLEIVSEPDMRSAAEAVAYARALHALVTWIGICDGNMQEGSFRVDANVSVRPMGSSELGTRREIKNLNSFRFLEQAINYEARWQIETIEDGGRVVQATVLFDPDSGETRMMRSKEDAHDYRYFPDPDLLPVVIGDDWIERVRAAMPELPEARRQRFITELGLSAYDAAVLTNSKWTADYFDEMVAITGPSQAKACANWVTGGLAAFLKTMGEDGISLDGISLVDSCPVNPRQAAHVVKRVADGTISSNASKEVFREIWNANNSTEYKELLAASQDDIADSIIKAKYRKQLDEFADSIIEAKGLKQMSDSSELEIIIAEVIATNAKSVDEYRAGKEKAFNALIGQVMRAAKGKANPQQVNDLLKARLDSGV
jgi:aspartyl-tRNA(Asn)/glutamyl-tRNA(Gln) amidotransferase subunit B